MASLAGSSLAPALAADLGGNCCADLEERIAELEATAARKGNRKVSLTVSGWVNQAVFFWDDGTERNVYVGTNDLEQDRFKLTGDAKIVDGWSAGYILEIGSDGASSKTWDQDNDNGTSANSVVVRKSAWYVSNKQLGKVTLGRYDTATYHLIDNINTLLTRNVSDFEATGVYIGAFKARSGGAFTGKKWSDYMGGFNNATPGQSGLRQVARYDTPEWLGFTASASWGEDDQGEAALKYKGELGDFKLNAAAGYGRSTDPGTNGGQCVIALPATGDCQWWGVGALVQHTPTGLYVYGGWAENQIDLTVPGDDQANTGYIQAGIEQKFFSLGKTNVFGEYRHDDVGKSKGAVSSNFDFWTIGVAQNIEASELTLYAMYRKFSGDFTIGPDTTELDDFDMVITGGKLNF